MLPLVWAAAVVRLVSVRAGQLAITLPVPCLPLVLPPPRPPPLALTSCSCQFSWLFTELGTAGFKYELGFSTLTLVHASLRIDGKLF